MQELYQQLFDINNKINDAKRAVNELTDLELNNLAREELLVLETKRSEIESKIEEIKDAKKNIKLSEILGDAIVEIRAGAGGNEAGLFANDIYQMYLKYADSKGFKTSQIYKNEGGLGNIKEVIFEIRSDHSPTPFELLRNESGVHRVQRVPATESSGRIHTSTITVAVLPIIKDVEINIKPDDLRIDTYRAGSAGGQHVNTTDSAVRITHLPTGLVVACQDERSQHKNKEKAMEVLKSRLFEMMKRQQAKDINELKSDYIGTGERAEKIRTYNYPQDRITDHRIGKSFYNIPKVMMGYIDEILESTKTLE